MPLNNLREAATRANAMMAGGMDSKKIIDRLLQSKTTPEVNQRIEQARQQGISDDKLVADLSRKSEQIQPTVTPEKLTGFKGALTSVGKFLGTEKLATRIGSELGIGGLSPDIRRRLGEAEEKGFVEPGVQRELQTGGVTTQQALGSALVTGAQLAVPFLGKALSPTYVGLKSAVGRNFLVGLPFGAGAALQEEDAEFGDVAGAAITSGIISAMFPLAEVGLKKLAKGLKGQPKKIYQSIFKPDKVQINKDLVARSRVGGQSIQDAAELALKEGRAGPLDDMALDIIQSQNQLEAQINAQARALKVKVSVDKNSYKQLLEGYLDAVADVPVKFSPAKETAQTLLKQVNKVKGNQSSTELALSLRRFLDSQRSTSSFRLNPSLGTKQAVYRKAADTLRSNIAKSAPSLANQLSIDSLYYKQIEQLIKQIPRENTQSLRFIDQLLIGGGLAGGGGLTGVIPAAGIRALTAPSIKTRGAQLLQTGVQAGERLLGSPAMQQLRKLEPIARQARFGATGQISRDLTQ